MQKRRLSSLLAISLLMSAATPLWAQTKAKLSEQDLAAHTYYFDIVDNKLTGPGGEFLAAEIRRSQYVLLGEYHGSLRISEFTKALIPLFHEAGCRHFGLEVGPVSAEILSELAQDPAQIKRNLHEFNTKFLVTMPKRTLTAIPFFSYVEDADFLAEARKRGWSLSGFDQEFAFSYRPLLERLYNNLKPQKKKELAGLYQEAVTTVNNAYETDSKGGQRSYITLQESAVYNLFLAAAAEKNPANRRIADALRKTTEIYAMNVLRKYYENNGTRIEYMKQNLRESFARLKFDLRQDKMLLKMGGVHTGRGFSPLAFFEIGNTLSELAKFHGNSSLHIDFGSRFYIEDGKEIDGLDDPKGFTYRFQPFLQMSKKDKWTVIDLRPLREAVFYRDKFEFSSNVLEIFKNHDLYLMPPLDKDPTPNYVVAKK
jgi:erythromycin esterase-like protein